MGLLDWLTGSLEKRIERLETELEVVNDFIALGDGTFTEVHADLSDGQLARRTTQAINYGRAKGWYEGNTEGNHE